VEKNKGAQESRTLESRPVTAEDIGFPFAAQAAQLTRQRAGRKDETVGLITDLRSDELTPRQWLGPTGKVGDRKRQPSALGCVAQ